MTQEQKDEHYKPSENKSRFGTFLTGSILVAGAVMGLMFIDRCTPLGGSYQIRKSSGYTFTNYTDINNDGKKELELQLADGNLFYVFVPTHGVYKGKPVVLPKSLAEKVCDPCSSSAPIPTPIQTPNPSQISLETAITTYGGRHP
ncbi:hypothetical protein HZB02_06430 [Candidatus Woesearchaeota archaeon]|nr:hypothetical protein [Candidatus Woesearchaeota archaeon]